MARAPKIADEKPSDFDTSELVVTHEQHEKDITDLSERVKKIEGHLCTPQALAGFFQESAKDSRVLEGVFAEMFCRFMNENDGVKIAVEKKFHEVDRNFLHKTFKRLWLPAYSAALILGTIVLQELAKWLISLIPHH